MSNRSLIFPLTMLCIVPMLLQAQKVVNVQHVPIKQAIVQNMTHPSTGLDVDIKFLEAPAPDGDSYWGALAAQKVKSAELYPKQQKSNIQTLIHYPIKVMADPCALDALASLLWVQVSSDRESGRDDGQSVIGTVS